ncbi:MAG TPA: nuclear transport factor 2 family protein [Gemmatimonadaceae bacterium]|nr:nuclear transport factor 2 family protein [Gemmatimonadaceae bacterium]
MTSRAFLLTLAVVSWHSSAAQIITSVTTIQRDAIADTVRKATADFLAAAQSVDVDKAGAFVSSSPDFAYVAQTGDITRTPEAWKQETREGWADVRSMQIRPVDSRIAVVSPTVAVETMSFSGTVVPKSGKATVVDKAAFTMVWVREPAGWKVLSFHQSFLPPRTD